MSPSPNNKFVYLAFSIEEPDLFITLLLNSVVLNSKDMFFTFKTESAFNKNSKVLFVMRELGKKSGLPYLH